LLNKEDRMEQVQVEKAEHKLLVVGLGRSALSATDRKRITSKPVRELDIKDALKATELPSWANGVLINLAKASAAAEHVEDLATQANMPCEIAMTLDATIEFIAKLPDIETELPTGGNKGMKLIEGIRKHANFKVTFGKQADELLKSLAAEGIETTEHSAEQCFFKVRKQHSGKSGREISAKKRLQKLTETIRQRRGSNARSAKRRTNGAAGTKNAFDQFLDAVEGLAKLVPAVRAEQEARTAERADLAKVLARITK